MSNICTENNKPMVFVLNKFNRGEYIHFTGNNGENTYNIKGDEYGKHLFKTLTIQAKDEDTFRDIAPLGTVLPDYNFKYGYLSEIDYYFEPKSVAAVVVDKLQACVSELEGSLKAFKRHRDSDYKELSNLTSELSDTKILNNTLSYEKCLVEGTCQKLREKLSASYAENKTLELENKKLSEKKMVIFYVFSFITVLLSAALIFM